MSWFVERAVEKHMNEQRSKQSNIEKYHAMAQWFEAQGCFGMAQALRNIIAEELGKEVAKD